MKFKELFGKEFLYESKKEDKKATKIFYKFDINIKKIDEEEAGQETPQVDQTVPQMPVDQGLAPVDQAVSQTPIDQTTPQAPVHQNATY